MIQLVPAPHAHLGRLFRVARHGRGLSLREASRVTSIRVVELSSIELGLRLPSEAEAERMAAAYEEPRKQLPGAG